jgi:Holliday junction resolvasome RuvABC endonuclease subunit
MLVLGIDAATTTGHATILLGEAGKLSVRRVGRIAARAGAISDLIAAAAGDGVVLAGLETPYLDKNPDTTIKLAMIAGRFAQELDHHRIPCAQLRADEWQKGLLTGLISGRSDRGLRKRAARAWVHATYKLDVTEDEADAICLATWLAKRAVLDRKTAAAVRRFGASRR